MNVNRNLSPRLLLAAVLLALGGATNAFAAPPPENCPVMGGQMEQRHAARMKELSRLHVDLKLDARQEALWQEAESQNRATMGEMREHMRRQREQVLASLSQPGADLHAVVRQMDEFREAGKQQREANRNRWLTVYDSLDAAQKEKARIFVKNLVERSGPGVRFAPAGPARN